MEENNENVETKTTNNNGVEISDEVVSVIAGVCVSEVNGVAEMAGGFRDGFFQAFFTEQFQCGIDGLRDAVRIEDERIARMEGDFEGFVFRLRHGREDKGRLGANPFDGFVRPFDEREIVACVGIGQNARLGVENAKPNRHKHVRFIVFRKSGVGFRENVRRGVAGGGDGADGGFGGHHEHGGRNALS